MVYLLIPGCYILAGLFIITQKKGHENAAILLKGLASLCFVALGFLCGAKAEGSGAILTGLTLGCIADLVLGLRNIFQKQRRLAFLMGGLVFLCGHVAYLTGIWPSVRAPLSCVLVSLALTGLLLCVLYRYIKAGRALKVFGGVYFGVLMLLNTAAFSNALTSPSGFSVLFAVGVLLFFASDVILNLYSFGPRLPFFFRVLYSGLYYTGQLLIALSLRFL